MGNGRDADDEAGNNHDNKRNRLAIACITASFPAPDSQGGRHTADDSEALRQAMEALYFRAISCLPKEVSSPFSDPMFGLFPTVFVDERSISPVCAFLFLLFCFVFSRSGNDPSCYISD